MRVRESGAINKWYVEYEHDFAVCIISYDPFAT